MDAYIYCDTEQDTLRAAHCLTTNNNNEYDACGKCVCGHALGCRMLEILMDSDLMPAGTLWRRSDTCPMHTQATKHLCGCEVFVDVP